jgi:hypothetical protein
VGESTAEKIKKSNCSYRRSWNTQRTCQFKVEIY